MKLALCLVFCLGLALARVEEWSWLADDYETSRTIDDSEFQSGHEFHYFYNGQMTTGIPGSSKQHSGTRVQALVTFLFTNQYECLMKLNNVRFGKINSELPTPRKLVKFDYFEEIPMEQMLKETLLLPIKFTYTNGLVKNVVFDGEEQPWSANIKRAIVNMLQVNIQQQHQSMDVLDVLPNIDSRRMHENIKDADVFYRVMEETIEGECETLYTITKPTKMSENYGRPIMNVTKSINFEKCKRRPEIKYNFRFSDPCPTCDPKYVETEKFLKASTVAQIGITGTPSKFLIDNAMVDSEYTFVPFSEESNVIMTYVKQTLKLVKTGPVSMRIEEPRQPIASDSDLIYSLDWDVAKETFHMEDDTTLLRKTMHPRLPNKVQLIFQVLEKLISKISESVDDVAPKHFTQLVTLFRMCTRQELEQVKEMIFNSNRFNTEEMKKVRDIMPHVVATCGTKVCVELLVEKIMTQQITTLTAISALKDLISIRTPSKEIISELLRLAESDVCERHFMLKQSVWLSIGSLMNALCSNNVDKWAREMKEPSDRFCPAELKERYVQLLVNKLHSTTKWEERLTYLKTLGNAGLDLSIFELEKIIRNVETQYSPLARSEAILALRQLRDVMPKKIQKVLMPVLMNKLESPTVRIAACYMMMQTLPERPILDQVAKMVFHERNMQVASFVYSYMDTLANSTNPCEKKFVTDMRLAMRHIKQIDTTPLSYSKITRIPIHSVHHKIGLDLELASSFVDRTHIPRYLTATLHSNFLGFWNKYLVSFGLVTENLETLLQKLVGEHKHLFEDETMMGGLFSHLPRSSFLNYDLNNIFSTFKSFADNDFEQVNKEPKGWFYMKFKDQDVGFLPLKEEMIREFLAENNFNLRDLQNKLHQGLPINMNKAKMLHEMVYKIPTTFGMPLTVTTRVPLVMSIQGKVQAVSNTLKNFKVIANLKPSFALTLAVDVECWSPIVNHGIKVVNKVKVFHPIDAKIEVDLTSPVKNLKITIRPPTTRRDIITLTSKPISYTRVWQNFAESDDKIIIGEEMNRVHKFNKCMGQRVFGVNICLRGLIKKSPTHSIVGTPFFPLSGPNKVVLSVEPSHETPEEIIINLSGKFLQTTYNQHSTEMFEDFETTERYNKYNTHQYEEEYNTPSQFESHYTPRKPITNMLKVDIIVGQSKRLSVDLIHTCDMHGRYGKLHMKVMHQKHSSEPIVLCLDSEHMYPENMRSEQVLCNTRLTWGRTCNTNNYITLRSKVQSLPMRNIFETEMPEFSNFENRYSTYKNSDMLKYVVDIDYNNVPFFVQNYTHKMFAQLKNKYFEHLDVSSVLIRNPENKIRAVITVDPVTKHYVNLVVKSPKQNVIINDIPTMFRMTPMNTKVSYIKKFLNFLRGDLTLSKTCQSCGQTLKTFDNVEQQFPLTTQFKVLVQDCSENQRCVVMMRKLRDNSDLKEIKIISENNMIMITPVSETDDQMKIIVNDREFRLENIDEIENLYQLPIRVYREGSEIKVELLTCGVTVSFNGLTCTIERCSRKSIPLCGPCGKVSTMDDYNNEFHSTYNKRGLYNKRCNKLSCKRNTMFDDMTTENKPYWEQTERMTMDDDREDLSFLNTFFHDEEEMYPTLRNLKRQSYTPSYLDNKKQEQRESATYWGLKDDNVEDDLFRSTLFEDDMPLLKSMRRREQRPMWGQSRKPTTFWGQETRKPTTTFWGLDEEEKRNDATYWGLNHEDRMENIDDVFQSMMYEDDMEMPTLKSMRRQQRPLRRNLENELPETRKFWGVEHENKWENVNEDRKTLVTPVLKHKIMEVENKVCFSMERVPECPVDCRPVNKIEKHIKYVCLHREDPQVSELETRIRYGESVVAVLDRMVPAKTRVEIIPTKCTKLF